MFYVYFLSWGGYCTCTPNDPSPIIPFFIFYKIFELGVGPQMSPPNSSSFFWNFNLILELRGVHVAPNVSHP